MNFSHGCMVEYLYLSVRVRIRTTIVESSKSFQTHPLWYLFPVLRRQNFVRIRTQQGSCTSSFTCALKQAWRFVESDESISGRYFEYFLRHFRRTQVNEFPHWSIQKSYSDNSFMRIWNTVFDVCDWSKHQAERPPFIHWCLYRVSTRASRITASLNFHRWAGCVLFSTSHWWLHRISTRAARITASFSFRWVSCMCNFVHETLLVCACAYGSRVTRAYQSFIVQV